MNTTIKDWTTIIKPKDKLLSVDFGELWRYRDLCMLFVKRNITTQYKQTILGPLWYLVQPMLTTLTYMVIFGGIAKIPTDGLPQPLFYLAGICLWQYFSDCLNKTSNTFVDNANIFGKVYFPRMITPVSNVISNLVRLGIQLGLFVVVYLIYQCFIIPGQIHTAREIRKEDRQIGQCLSIERMPEIIYNRVRRIRAFALAAHEIVITIRRICFICFGKNAVWPCCWPVGRAAVWGF